MNTITKNLRLALACTASVLALSPSAFAAGTWTLDNNCAGPIGGANTHGNSFTCASSDTNDPSVTATGWGTTGGAGGAFAIAALNDFDPNGFGVRNQGEGNGSPNHSMDNAGNLDATLLSFESSVILSQVMIGWSQTDSDLSVLRYTAPGAPTIDGNSAAGLLGNGWELVGQYGNNVVNVATDINSSNLSSSYWLVSAYSASYGGSSMSAGNDYVKLLAVSGTPTAPPAGGLPEPTSLALVAVALAGMGAARHRKAATRFGENK